MLQQPLREGLTLTTYCWYPQERRAAQGCGLSVRLTDKIRLNIRCCPPPWIR